MMVFVYSASEEETVTDLKITEEVLLLMIRWLQLTTITIKAAIHLIFGTPEKKKKK